MAKKKNDNERFLVLMKENQIRNEYNEFLKDEGKENNLHSANLFAVKKISGNYDYFGMKERELILFLCGDLPYMYD